jgi:hypothetical protein
MLSLVESINKIDSAPCENSSLANVNCSCPRRAAYSDVLHKCEGGVWRHEPLSRLRGGYLKIQRRPVQNLELCGNAMRYSARWRLASIDDFDFNNERAATVVRNDLAGSNTQVSSQLPFGGFSGQLNAFPRPMVLFEGNSPHSPNLFFAGFPQLVSSSPQGEGECGNRDSCERSEKPIVLIDKPQSAGRLCSDEDGDAMALIAGVFGGLAGALLTCAGLKRVCDLVFSQNKQG